MGEGRQNDFVYLEMLRVECETFQGLCASAMDFLAYITVRALLSGLNCLPLALRITVVSTLVKVVSLIIPRFRKIGRRNFDLAFPNIPQSEREALLKSHYVSLARLIVDFARLPQLDAEWVQQHVACPFLPRFEELKRDYPGKGIVIATGHLGSFELLAHCVAMYGYPISFVVRLFNLPRLSAWWTGIREQWGNKVISRDGAFKEIVKDLSLGRDVAVLFDQNVKRNHAVFVPWFGRPAATTKSVALAAIRTEAPVIAAAIVNRGPDNYEILAKEFDFFALYADQAISIDKKVEIITTELSKCYEDFIRQSPAEWFWFHRRWKTAPTDEAEKFYE
ncbi:MAG: hypothetical protein K1X79_05675 [Oligoflexia bacterium]|nr:hypothetical protein [Oligoflexia bacterium]